MNLHYRFETWPAYEIKTMKEENIIDKMHNRLVSLENSIRRIDENIANMASLNAKLHGELEQRLGKLESDAIISPLIGNKINKEVGMFEEKIEELTNDLIKKIFKE